MAKKKDKKASRTDTVRAAVDQAFQATAQATVDAGQLTRERAAEIADELVGNITRLRDALDDARPATGEDLKALRIEIASLGERVGRLETARAAAAITADGPAAKPAAAKAPARAATTRRAGAKPAAAKPSARASASRTAAAKRTTAAAAAAKPGAKKASAKAAPARKARAAAKPTAAARPRPAAPAKAGAAKLPG